MWGFIFLLSKAFSSKNAIFSILLLLKVVFVNIFRIYSFLIQFLFVYIVFSIVMFLDQI